MGTMTMEDRVRAFVRWLRYPKIGTRAPDCYTNQELIGHASAFLRSTTGWLCTAEELAQAARTHWAGKSTATRKQNTRRRKAHEYKRALAERQGTLQF
jgi:hypothetical protein